MRANTYMNIDKPGRNVATHSCFGTHRQAGLIGMTLAFLSLFTACESYADLIYLMNPTSISGGTIDRFDSSGTYLGSFQSDVANAQGSLTLDDSGNIYAATMGKIQKYSPSGDVLLTIDSQYPDGLGLAVDSEGNIYATETDASMNSFIRKFSPTGADLGRIGTYAYGSFHGLAFHSGLLYAAVDGSTDDRRPPDGAHIELFTTAGVSLGNFIKDPMDTDTSPYIANISFDLAGNVYVAPGDNGGVLNATKFDAAGNIDHSFVYNFNNSIGPGGSSLPRVNWERNIGALSDGNILANYADGLLTEYSSDGQYVGSTIDTQDPNSALYVGNPSSPYYGNASSPQWSAMVIQPAPEPTGISLITVGAIAMMSRRERRRRI